MPRHPAENFVAFLCVSLEDAQERTINSTLRLYGLAPIERAELGRIRQGLTLPEGFKAWDPNDPKSKRWLKQKAIYSLLHPDETTQEMKSSILEAPAVREKVDTLLIGRVSASEASYRLQKQGHQVSAAAIEEYRHYFWNTEIMGLADWAEYFRADADPDDGSLRTQGRKSPLKSSLLGGPDLAKYKAGISIELDNKKILAELQQELYFTFREVKTLPVSDKKVAMLSALTRSLARLDERISSSDQALQDTLKRFEKFKVITDTTKPPAITQLAPQGSISSRSRTEVQISREK
jgi:hypothetical protein